MPQTSRKTTVGLIATDQRDEGIVADEGAPAARLFSKYIREARELAARGAKVIVLPEKIAVVVDADSKNSDSLFQSLADSTGSTIVVGEIYAAGKTKYNQARVYAPAAAVLTYDKHHMLPPFESNLKPGTSLTLMPKGSETWGVAICKDMDFTPLSRKYGQAGAGLMLVPAWDFQLDRAWHGHIAVMRGVEDGFSIVRAARDGYLTVSDNRGRILRETRSDSAPFATLVAAVPAEHEGTPYVMLGDWFAWFAIAALTFSVQQLRASRKRQDCST